MNGVDPFIVGAVVIAGAVIFFFFWLFSTADKERRAKLIAKYGETEKAQRLINRELWIGQSAEELVDSFGEPEAIQEKILKTKNRIIYKYNRIGVNRYSTKITLDDGFVSTWDRK